MCTTCTHTCPPSWRTRCKICCCCRSIFGSHCACDTSCPAVSFASTVAFSAKSCSQCWRKLSISLCMSCFFQSSNDAWNRKKLAANTRRRVRFGPVKQNTKCTQKMPMLTKLDNGVYSSLFRAKASGGHSKARETRDAQFLQKFTRFALIAVTSNRPRVCKCPPPRVPVSQSTF